jgi:hypothetical protein
VREGNSQAEEYNRNNNIMPSFDEIRSSVSGSLQKAGSRVGLASVSTDEEEQKHPDRLDELSEICPKLTFQQVRMILCIDG